MGKSLLVTEGILAANDLRAMIVSLEGMKDSEVHHYGLQLYGKLHLTHEGYGLHQTHDGQRLVFHVGQFDRAFFTTSDRYCYPERKDVLRRGSIERIRWIMPLLNGQVCGSACFEVPSPTGRRKPPNRL